MTKRNTQRVQSKANYKVEDHFDLLDQEDEEEGIILKNETRESLKLRKLDNEEKGVEQVPLKNENISLGVRSPEKKKSEEKLSI